MAPATPESSENKHFSFIEALEVFLERLPARSRTIVEARFGIGEGKDQSTPKTLEEIGKSYGITRERVRQVIGSALSSLRKEQGRPEVKAAEAYIQSTLEKKSGIMGADALLETLASDERERGALLVFLECLSGVRYEKPAKDREAAYMTEGFSLTAWQKVADTAKKILAEKKESLDSVSLFGSFRKSGGSLDETAFFDYLSVSKDVKRNVFGQWGLSGWNDIKPRGTREKAYLVLKTKKKPLHFREIARLIDEYGLHARTRKSHPQTVHNELIKDKRFVLVGRGIYALAEWGYKKGTVKEVVEEILRGAKEPMSRETILDRVLKVRKVKKSTVIINLNMFFSRVGKDTYTIRK